MNKKWWGNLFPVLAGLYPFFYFGPLMVLLGYPYPPPAWHSTLAFQLAIILLSTVPIGAGLALGWLKRFPLWSYAYVCLVVFFLITGTVSLFSGPLDFGPNTLVLVAWILALLLAGGLFYITRHNSPLPGLWVQIRADWTRLSLGMLVLPAVLFGAIDHDETPVLTGLVIAPGVVLLLTALLGLLARSKRERLVILALGLVLALVISLVNEQMVMLFYWLFAVGFVFAPAAVELRGRGAKGSTEI
jgi:hypothetical protein